MSGLFETLRKAALGTGQTAFIVIGAIVIGFGVPTLWIFLASQIYDQPGAVTGGVAAFIFIGIVVTYWLLLVIASWLRARISEEARSEIKRSSWNRSLRDVSQKPGSGKTDPIERLFITTALLSLVGFAIWFAFFAGAPVPSG